MCITFHQSTLSTFWVVVGSILCEFFLSILSYEYCPPVAPPRRRAAPVGSGRRRTPSAPRTCRCPPWGLVHHPGWGGLGAEVEGHVACCMRQLLPLVEHVHHWFVVAVQEIHFPGIADAVPPRTHDYRYSNGQRFRVYWLYWVISGYIYRTGKSWALAGLTVRVVGMLVDRPGTPCGGGEVWGVSRERRATRSAG